MVNTTLEISCPNEWLIQKRQKMVEDETFSPSSYLHLAHFWGYVTDEQLKKGRRYGKLRGLLDLAQGNQVVWTHKLSHPCPTGRQLSLDQEEKIEKLWRKVRLRLTPKDMLALDWLVQEPLRYDWDPPILRQYLKKMVYALDKL